MATPGSGVLVVTTGRARGSLAAVRALGRAGWDVGVGLPDGRGIVTSSRWCRKRHDIPRPRGDALSFVAAVRTAVDERGYAVVFGGGDDSVAALALYREHIPAIVAHPPAQTVMAAIDKINLARCAGAVGFAVPRIEAANDTALRAWSGAVVVKCRAHWRHGLQRSYRIEARRFPDALSAAPRVAYIAEAGLEPVLQEVIDGRLGALIGLVHEGRLHGRVQQETIAVWPTPNGVSTRARSVVVDEALAARAEALLAALGWSGLVELQFMTTTAGEHYLIDLNGRFYGSMALSNAAGPNLADAWARQALGQPIPRLVDGRTGVSFAWLAGDLRRALAERQGGLVCDVASTLRWAHRSTTSSIWDRHDIKPGIALIAEAATASVEARFKRHRPPGRWPTDDPRQGKPT